LSGARWSRALKVLIVADIHYSLRQYDWLMQVGPSYDMVIVAGDLLDIAGHVDLDTQIVVVSKYLARLGALVPLVVCSGNHDADGRNAADEAITRWLEDVQNKSVHIDGEHIPLPQAMITVCPWWDGPETRKAVETLLAAAERPAVLPWIWIHHVPPNTARISWDGHTKRGDTYLDALIGRLAPDIVVSGHVHAAPFRSGGSWVDRIGGAWVFNPGRQLGEIPAFIELDLDARTATWISAAGVEDVCLADVDTGQRPVVNVRG
jgi:Icc-related predicted phosphoesterase